MTPALIVFQNIFYIAIVKHASVRHMVIVCVTIIAITFFSLKAKKRIYKPTFFFPLEVSNLPLLEAPGGSDINSVHLSYSIYLVT